MTTVQLSRGILILSIVLLLNLDSAELLTFVACGSLKELQQLLDLQSHPEGVTDLSVQHSHLGTLKPRLFEQYRFVEQLRIQYNEILRIGNEDFYGLHKLHTLNLINNGIEEIEKEAFTSLRELITLDVSNNLITQLDNNLFKSLKKLKLLRLADNLIRKLEPGIFNQVYLNRPSFDFTSNKIQTLSCGLFTNFAGTDVKFSSNNITTIEDGAFQDSSFSSLHLDNNQISDINPENFKNSNVFNELRLAKNRIRLQPENFKHLKTLERLYLANNGITSIPDGCFQGLTNLNTLQLRDNNIAELKSASFAFLPNLRTLFLSANPIKLSPDVFKHLTTLVFLHLDNCLLDVVDPNLFQNMRQLSVLNLGKNQIVRMPENILYDLLPALKNLYLDNNLIEKIEQGAFLNSRRRLNFHYLLLKLNIINTIEVGAFEGIQEVYSLQLQQNRLKSLPEGAFKHVGLVKTLRLEDNLIEDFHNLKNLPPANVVLLEGNVNLEKTDLPLNDLNIQNVDFIGFKNFSYQRVDNVWEFVDEPVEL